MIFLERLESLERVAQFIRQERTGDARDFARKCGISKDALFDQIDNLRQILVKEEVKIGYDRGRKTYYFEPRGQFVVKFTLDNHTEP